MRALVLPAFGSVAEIREIDVPEPGAGEVRVRVHAASVNGFDLSVAASTTLDRLADAVARNRVRIAVEGVYPLAEAPQALAHFAGGTRGKTVLTVG